MDLSIVIPVYNSEKILPALMEQITSTLDQLPSVREYEVVLVNDCSRDRSWRVIDGLCDSYPMLRGIDLRKNTGQHNAIMAGLNHARGRVIITMDDDLQHSPKYIGQLYEKIEAGYDVCYAKFTERKHSWWQVWGSKFNDRVAAVMLDKPQDIYLSPFKALKAEVKDEIIQYTGAFAYVDGLILMVTRNLTSIDVEHHARYEGKSNYSFVKGVTLWMKMATNFSVVPLRIASFVGLMSAFVGFLLAIVLVVKKLTMNVPVRGWSSLIITVLIMGGIQLVALGAIGEYLGRAYISINKKPQYVVRAKRNLS